MRERSNGMATVASRHREYSSFGETLRETSQDRVQRWLHENEFDEKAQISFLGYTEEDLLRLTKDDARLLLGNAEGIRLYNRLREVRHSAEGQVKRISSPIKTEEPDYSRREPCGEPGCDKKAFSRCSTYDCQRALCAEHVNKFLVTGNRFCSECYEKPVLEKLQTTTTEEMCIVQ